MEHLRAHLQAGREALGAAGDDHELLEVDLVVRMGAAVEHVHHRHRQQRGGRAAEVAPQRLTLLGRLRLGAGERDTQDRVGSQPGLVGGSVELDQSPVEGRLVGRVGSGEGRRDLSLDVLHRAGYALASVGLAAIAQLGRLELARRSTRGDRRATCTPRGEGDLHLDRRVAAAVEDLTGVDSLDLAHAGPPGELVDSTANAPNPASPDAG